MAFVLFVFLMASSVLLAGAPLRHAWFVEQSSSSSDFSQQLIYAKPEAVGLPVLPSFGQGLRSMRERASRVGGLLEVERARNLGGGRRVRARLPFRALVSG